MTEDPTSDDIESFFDAIQHVGAAHGRHIPMVCETCGAPTSERKPRCIEHITEMPIAKEITKEIERRTRELDRVRRLGTKAVKLTGTRAQEILDFIRDRESVTIGKIASEVLVSVKLVKHYVARLEKAGQVKVESVSSKGHGTLVITIIEKRVFDDE